jgi:hypothetical protein
VTGDAGYTLYIERLPNCLFRDAWESIFPGGFGKRVHEVIDSLVIDIQWMHIEKGRFITLHCFATIIDLEVAFSEVRVCFILMPPDHEIPVGLHPLNLVEIVRMVRWEVKRDVELRLINLVRRSEESWCVDRGSDPDFVSGGRVVPDLLD